MDSGFVASYQGDMTMIPADEDPSMTLFIYTGTAIATSIDNTDKLDETAFLGISDGARARYLQQVCREI